MNKKGQGRPLGSKVRQNIVEILYFYKQMHGYDIYKVYTDLYPPVTLRLIYYHLRKGLDTKEFRIQKISHKEGNYSWGNDTENIIYELGEQARPIIEPRIKMHWEKNKK